MIALLFCCVVNGWLTLFGCLVDCVLVVFVFVCFLLGLNLFIVGYFCVIACEFGFDADSVCCYC